MSNSFEQFQKFTNIVADTADFLAIKRYNVTEATTNPIIITKAAALDQYKEIVQDGVDYGSKTGKTPEEKVENALDMINVLFAKEILKVVKQKVHVQIDPRLAFDVEKGLERVLKITKLISEKGISNKEFVIKIPATWEGIELARLLESKYDVRCNLTTLFTLEQAAAGAEAGVTYLSPFIGRIRIWHQEKSKGSEEHEGVATLKIIQNYLRHFEFKTKVMAAYFVNLEEVKATAGCDNATLPEDLLEALTNCKDIIVNNMDPENCKFPMNRIVQSESEFKASLKENEMVAELLPEILTVFINCFVELEDKVKEMLGV